MTIEVTQEAEGRFWAKVDIRTDAECWEWLGGKSSDGYGRFHINRRARPATRVAWEILHRKPFPEGLLACHSCDNPGCVNPRHIWAGTQSENLKDCVSKGRHKAKPKDECKYGHKLTADNRVHHYAGQTRCKECARVSSREKQRRYRARHSAGETPLSETRRKAWETRRVIYGESGRAG